MDDIKKIYHDLTGVDITEQCSTWDERGKGYFGEYLVFCDLYSMIDGNCKILMNLKIPTSSGSTTEIDLLMIHETGIYVFEIKHYKGAIYGQSNEPSWTQYFRTINNNSFPNPVYQNQYHIKALRNLLHDTPIYSVIVFTNDVCELHVQNTDPSLTICTRSMLKNTLDAKIHGTAVYDINKIDSLFRVMSQYAPIAKQTALVDDKDVPLQQYLETIINNYKNDVAKLETECRQKISATTDKVKRILAITIGICLLCIIVTAFICISKVTNAQTKLDEFASKFEYVDDFDNGTLQVKKDLVLVSNTVLEESEDIDNTVLFSCTLTWNGDMYGVSFDDNVKVIVILKDGSIKEYDYYNDSDSIYSREFMLGESGYPVYREIKTKTHQLYDLNISEIAYIKFTNLGIWTKVGYSREEVASDYEIEVYNAQ